MRIYGHYSPANVVKPKPEDWGPSLCKVCLNPELKVEALKEPGVNLEWLLSLDDVQLKNWGDRQKPDELVTYKE